MISIEREKLLALIQEHRNAQRNYMDLAIANDGAAQALEHILQEFDDQEAVDLDRLISQMNSESAGDEAAE